jgi:hypothetical protein
VFTNQEIAHFRAFGFVVPRGLLDESETAQLTAEVRTSLISAYGGLGTDHDPAGTGGIRGDYLPLSVDAAPLSQALIADDPRLYQGSVELTGGPTVPTVPIATCFTTNAGWHNDDGTDVGGVKFLAHLEPRRPDTGALRVIPGSHDPGFADRLRQYGRLDPAMQGFDDAWPMPHVALETGPGDVIAFDLYLFHSSQGGSARLAWSIEYRPWPGLGDTPRLRAVRQAVVEAAEFSHKDYDRAQWPTWSQWARGARNVPSRRSAVQLLELMGSLSEEDR